MAGFGGSVKLTGESDYRKALKQITLDLKEVDSELKVVTSQYDKNDKSEQALTAQSEALTKKLDAQAKKIGLLKDNYAEMSKQADENKKRHEALKSELENATKLLADVEKESGKDSEAYKELAGYVSSLTTDYEKSQKAIDSQEQALTKARTEINNTQTAYNDTEKTLQGLSAELNTTDKQTDKLSKNIKTSGDEAKKASSGGFTVLKGILANLGAEALKAVPKALIDGVTKLGKGLAKTAIDSAKANDEIIKNARNANLSAKSYQEWSYVLKRSGASIDGMKSAMLKLETASQNGNKAFKALGISSKQLKKMTPEQTFEATIKALQGVEDEGKRAVLASKLLGKGFGSDLGSLLSMSSKDVEGLKQRVNELGGVLSDDALKGSESFIDGLTDIKTSLTGIKNNIVSQFLPSLTGISEGLANVFSGSNTTEGLAKISEGVSAFATQLASQAPAFIQTASTIINSLLTALIGSLPQISTALNQVISDSFPILSKLLIDGLPVIAQAVSNLLIALGEQLPTIITQLFGALETVITQVTTWLTEGDNLEKFVNSIVQLTSDLTTRFSELLPVLIPALLQIITGVATALTSPENIEILIQAVLELAKGVFLALVNSVPVLIDFVKNMISNLAGLFADFLGQAVPFVAGAIEKIVNTVKSWGNSVKDFISGLVNGIKNTVSTWINNLKTAFTTGFNTIKEFVGSVVGKVSEFVTNIFNTIKTLPEKIISIGANIAVGIWNGLKSKLNFLKDKIKEFGSNIVNNIKKVFKIASPSKVTKELGGYLAEGLGEGFTSEMRAVNADIKNALPEFDTMLADNTASAQTQASSIDYYTIVNAFKDALTGVDIELDDQKLGKFVKKTVTSAIYTT